MTRALMHRRLIDSAGYRRADGLWEVEARMSDTKTQAMYHPAHGALPQNEPYQSFLVRLVLNDDLVLQEIHAEITTAPSGECRQAEAAYRGLVGKRIDRGVMRDVRAVVGGTAGCTNLTELLRIAAVTAIQTIGGHALGEPGGDGGALTGLVDTCHALRADGEVIRLIEQRRKSRS